MKLILHARLPFICSLIFFVACLQRPKEIVNPTIYQDFEPEKLLDAMMMVSDSLKNDTLTTHFYDTLSKIYKGRDYEPFWINKINDSAFQANLFSLWDSVPFEGLKASHYQCKDLEKLILGISTLKKKNMYIDLALLDVQLSNSILLLWHDKVLGRTNPVEVLGAKYTLPYPSKSFNLLAVLDVDSGIYKIAHYHPAHVDYWKLKNLLTLKFGETDGSETMIDTAGVRKLKPGDTTLLAPLIARRLVELGMAPDSLISITDSTFIYLKVIANYVKEFQRISNVTDDAVIGKSTLKLLNASKNDKINEIRVNMERIRWFSESPPKPYIMVNIPEFLLYPVYSDSLMVIYKDSLQPSKVCVGQGKEKYFEQKLLRYEKTGKYSDKPQNHETPQIYSTIDYVILNPTWTVPASIVGREMYSKIVRDPGYLIRNGYQVFNSDNKPVNPYHIRWRNYSPGNIPYKIRQDAGDENSLGRIKFTFRNDFSVYMHDTPLKSKFKLNNRAVSHGCVRVENPFDLAGFILQNNKKVTYDDLLVMTGRSPKDTALARKWREDTTSYKKIVKGTYPIRVENKMVVFFDYKTIVFDEIGNPRFIFDVYDKNRLIVEAMDKP